MTSFSPIPIYVFSALLGGLGVYSFVSPRAEYPRFGLPLEAPIVDGQRSKGGFVSPLMYLKGIREVTYCIFLAALQYQGNDSAITTFLCVLSLAALGDGILVYTYGGDKRLKALGHWTSFVGLNAWAWWRSRF